MGFWSTIEEDLGIAQSSGYTFSQQQKDFIKAQFKYALLLKQKLASGEITQAYYDQNYWLTTQTLDAPYNGWWQEFKAAIDSEDLNWLASQVGETVDALKTYMGDALTYVTKTAGQFVGTAISSTVTGGIEGFFGSLNIFGWLTIGAMGVAVWYGWKKGLIQKAFKIV